MFKLNSTARVDETRGKGNFSRLPKECLSEAMKSTYGPCVSADRHIPLMSNLLGPLELQPCGSERHDGNIQCGAIFVYSETYGWLRLQPNSATFNQAARLIDEANASGGFKGRLHLRRY